MPRRAASVTQADIARAIRAMKAEGFAKVRVVMVDGGIAVEPADRPERRADEFEDEGLVRREPVELL